jgi:hypothetical protein
MIPKRPVQLILDNEVVWCEEDTAIAEQIPIERARLTLKDRTTAYHRGEIEIRRNGMLWREEKATTGARWEFKKADAFDPDRLDQEAEEVPTAPPLLGVPYHQWRKAPRAIPIGKDPLGWLRLCPDQWQVSEGQIVSKGQGGYLTDGQDHGLGGYEDRDSLPRFPDHPSTGQPDLWDLAKNWCIRYLMDTSEVEWRYAEFGDGQRMGRVRRDVFDPAPAEVHRWKIANWRRNDPDTPYQELVEEFKIMAITHGWPRFVRQYRQAQEGEVYYSEMTSCHFRRIGENQPDVQWEDVWEMVQDKSGPMQYMFEQARIQEQYDQERRQIEEEQQIKAQREERERLRLEAEQADRMLEAQRTEIEEAERERQRLEIE